MLWRCRRPHWCLTDLSEGKKTPKAQQWCGTGEKCGWLASEAASALGSSGSSSGHESWAGIFSHNLLLPGKSLFAIS